LACAVRVGGAHAAGSPAGGARCAGRPRRFPVPTSEDIMKALRVVGMGLLVSVLVVASGCGSSKPKDLIIGKWEVTEKLGDKEMKGTYEFTKDGTLKMSMGPISMDAKYKFIDDNNFEMTMEIPGLKETKSEKIKIESITSDKMVASDPKGEKKEFKKVK
jgi:uncharacterized protein (TIGR03066 family)